MEATTGIRRPEQALSTKPSFSSERHFQVDSSLPGNNEFDPCQNAKICSPFYLYNHDSPRASADGRQASKQSIHVSIRDLEMGDLTPSITQEKASAQKQDKNSFKFWCRQKKCLTKPKERKWLQKLPKRQRMLVKICLALLIIGVILGVAVGIAAGVHSGVYGSNKQVGQ